MLKYLLSLFLLIVSSNLWAQNSETLDAITALENNKKVYLKWIINEGNTCNGIKIYRSLDSINFSVIGQIPGICGSATEKTAYEFIDVSPAINAKNYYKIEMGSLGFSKVVALEVFDFSRGIIIRPQPAKDFFQIVIKNDLRKKHTLKIYNLAGDIIYEFESTDVVFNVSIYYLSTGVYFYKIGNPEFGELSAGKILISN